MANSMQTNVKKIALAIGAVVEMSYLYAGADKGIEAEMQGKDNGDTIYYKTTQLGDPKFVDEIGNNGSGNDLDLTATDIKQVTVPVKMSDSCVMYNVKAFERQVTSIGESSAKAKVGQKLGKKAVGKIIDKDVKSIGNVFIADANSPFESFQAATSFLKSHVDGNLFGFMDWQVWGALTGKGQQAVPCALAEGRFGKGLAGSWALIDQLRTIGDIGMITGPSALAAGATASVNEAAGTVTIAGASAAIKKGDMFTIEGVYAKDVNDMATSKLFVFQATEDIGAGDATAKISNANYGLDGANGWTTGGVNVTAGKVTSIFSAAGKKFAATIIRAEGAQCFGTMKTCDCEGAKYEKSEIDGVVVHVNSGENIGGLKTEKRFDMIFASKLVEPRAAVLVLYPLG